ncbi:hypothetical protein PGB90_005397 [Kerria lacca]
MFFVEQDTGSSNRQDVDDVKFVINYDFPNTSEDYIHRIGRTGRSSQTGTSYAFFTKNNSRLAKDLINVLKEANQQVNPELAEMASYGVDLSRIKTRNLKRIDNREITINFNADKSSLLRWNFKPLQIEIKVVPGETVLAFYSAENPTDHSISGISTYSIVPYEAAKYFNKIQCFCFDEQRLNPHEQVDMPVFFYIDPDIINDPYMVNIKDITLSYTFFEAVEGLDLPFMSSFKE